MISRSSLCFFSSGLTHVSLDCIACIVERATLTGSNVGLWACDCQYGLWRQHPQIGLTGRHLVCCVIVRELVGSNNYI
jgi:hypothetical protein